MHVQHVGNRLSNAVLIQSPGYNNNYTVMLLYLQDVAVAFALGEVTFDLSLMDVGATRCPGLLPLLEVGIFNPLVLAVDLILSTEELGNGLTDMFVEGSYTSLRAFIRALISFLAPQAACFSARCDVMACCNKMAVFLSSFV